MPDEGVRLESLLAAHQGVPPEWRKLKVVVGPSFRPPLRRAPRAPVPQRGTVAKPRVVRRFGGLPWERPHPDPTPPGLRPETSPLWDTTPWGLNALSAGTQGSARRATLG